MLRTEEAAKYLGVKKSTMEAWRCRGGGPDFCKYESKAIRYDISDLDAFKQKSRRRSTSQGSPAGAR